MKRIVILLFISLSCCSTDNRSGGDVTEALVDVLIEMPNGKTIQFLDLYDTLSRSIPDDKDEKLFLAEILKSKGFKVTKWGRGNMPSGPRIINFELTKDDCMCRVNKVYVSTNLDSIYHMTEEISCQRISSP